jgi:dihydroorotase-like cyclic amidohydrolase
VAATRSRRGKMTHSRPRLRERVATQHCPAAAPRSPEVHANVLQVGHRERLAELFGMIAHRSTVLLNLKDHGLAVGNLADLVIIDAQTQAEAVATMKVRGPTPERSC